MTLATRRRFARHVVREARLKAGQGGGTLPTRELVHVLLLWVALMGVVVLVGYAFYGVWHGWG